LKRPDRSAVFLIGAVALQRVAFLLLTRDDPVFRVPYLDGAFYHVWARSLAAGHGDFQGAYFLGPFYPYWLALWYRILGADPWSARLVQSALGVLDVALVLSIGRRVFGRTAGFAAAVALGLYGPLVFHENLLVLDVVLLTLALAALALLLRDDRASAWRGVGVGLALGAAALARPTALLLAPVAVWWLWTSAGPSRRSVVALALVAWAALLVPIAARNARLGGGFTLTTNGGVNFYAGNGPGANGRFREPEGVHFFTAPVLADAVGGAGAAAIPTAIVARALTVKSAAGTEQAANSALWMARARAWMRREPAAAAALPFRKAWLLLQAQEIPQVESYTFHAQRLPALRWMAVDFGWLWPFAALGVWRAWRRRETRMVAVWAVALLAPCVMFFVTARHRLIAAPEVALLCGAGVAAFGDAVRGRAWRSVAGALMVMIPVAVAARAGARPPASARGWEHAQMAERLYASGDLRGAIQEQEAAAHILPDRIEAQLNLAAYWSESHNPGDGSRALALSQDIVRRWPENAPARYSLGEQLWSHGRRDEAVASWSDALQLDPSFEPARARLEALRRGGGAQPSLR